MGSDEFHIPEAPAEGSAQAATEPARPVGGNQRPEGDRFDRLPRSNRVGAHRADARPSSGWKFVLGGLIAVIIIVVASVLVLNFGWPWDQAGAPGSSQTQQEETTGEDPGAGEGAEQDGVTVD